MSFTKHYRIQWNSSLSEWYWDPLQRYWQVTGWNPPVCRGLIVVQWRVFLWLARSLSVDLWVSVWCRPAPPPPAQTQCCRHPRPRPATSGAWRPLWRPRGPPVHTPTPRPSCLTLITHTCRSEKGIINRKRDIIKCSFSELASELFLALLDLVYRTWNQYTKFSHAENQEQVYTTMQHYNLLFN